MKKLFCLLALGVALVSCENDTIEQQSDEVNIASETIDLSDFSTSSDKSLAYDAPENSRKCKSMEVLERQIKENPSLYNKMLAIEQFTRLRNAKKPGGGNGNGNGNGNGGSDGGGSTPTEDNLGTLNIPVIVHVIYNNANENISAQQIDSQIAVLNEDFRATNGAVSQVPSEFAGLVADSNINFSLSQVIRVASTRTSWGTNDAMKYASNGGSDAVTPNAALNIWVCNIGGGILGYAQFPGGNSNTDGVVVSPQYFGTTGFVSSPFDGGRTATHEVGHWLNLRHIWGDGRCRQDDFVADTPSSDAPNYGCPSYPTVNCRSNDMTMNYMDYVNDDCMYMFSQGQKERMRALFASGGPRATFVN